MSFSGFPRLFVVSLFCVSDECTVKKRVAARLEWCRNSIESGCLLSSVGRARFGGDFVEAWRVDFPLKVPVSGFLLFLSPD